MSIVLRQKYEIRTVSAISPESERNRLRRVLQTFTSCVIRAYDDAGKVIEKRTNLRTVTVTG